MAFDNLLRTSKNMLAALKQIESINGIKRLESWSQSQRKWKILLGATPTYDIAHGRRELQRETWLGVSGSSELQFSGSGAEGGVTEGPHL